MVLRVASKKRGIDTQVLFWIIVGVITLAIMFFAYLGLKENGFSIIEYVKNLLRFGR